MASDSVTMTMSLAVSGVVMDYLKQLGFTAQIGPAAASERFTHHDSVMGCAVCDILWMYGIHSEHVVGNEEKDPRPAVVVKQPTAVTRSAPPKWTESELGSRIRWLIAKYGNYILNYRGDNHEKESSYSQRTR
jgi:hypothetical protein